MEFGQFDYAPKTTYGKDSLLASLISGHPSLVSERGLGTRLRPIMEVFYMWSGNEVTSRVCRQANEGILYLGQLCTISKADIFTNLHVSGSTFSV